VEPKAADRLDDNINALSTVYYGFSVFHCMTQSLAQGGPGLGTCMGPARTEKLLREAGFTHFEQLDIKNMTSLFYAAQRQRGPKVYSLHAPEVECIGKGKAHRPYEFGVKVSALDLSSRVLVAPDL
jgi:hypothetical protein